MFKEIIKKSKAFTEAIEVAAKKIALEEELQVILPEPFNAFMVQPETHPEFPGEPIDYKEFGVEKNGHFYLVVTDL